MLTVPDFNAFLMRSSLTKHEISAKMWLRTEAVAALLHLAPEANQAADFLISFFRKLDSHCNFSQRSFSF